MRLRSPEELESSSVVANCTMNRERQIVGGNGYERELRIHPLAFLRDGSFGSPVSWVDLCCGTGRALLEAAAALTKDGNAKCLHIEGIDLAGMFHPNPFSDILALHEQSIETWEPIGPYALVTCVHGLHYVGDKLAAITKAVSHLHPNGYFVANLDLANFRDAEGRPAGRKIASRLRGHGFSYETRLRLLRRIGPWNGDLGFRYLGADDDIGPNYTGQPAVDSYYAF